MMMCRAINRIKVSLSYLFYPGKILLYDMLYYYLCVAIAIFLRSERTTKFNRETSSVTFGAQSVESVPALHVPRSPCLVGKEHLHYEEARRHQFLQMFFSSKQ